MKASDVDKVLYYDLDDSYTSLCFFRAPSVDVSKKMNQTVDITIGTNNRWDIWTSKTGDNQDVGAQRWVNGAAIDGLLNPKNPHTQTFNGDGEFTATLAAHSTYEFKVLDNITLYGLNEDVLTSSVSEQTLNNSGYQVRLCTAGAGDYKFTWDSENKKLSVDYPDVDHPNIDYCYVIRYDSWSPNYDLHVWGGTSTYVAEWNPNSTISGTTAPGVDLSNYVTIGGTNYFYIAPGNFTDFVVTKNNDANDRTYNVQSADGYGKRRYWKDASDGWIWDTFTVRIQLENNGANVGEKGTEYVDVAFNSDALDDDIEVPVKDGYTFGGYYTEDGGAGTQLISAAGKWTTSAVEDYLDASHHWIHAGMSTTLYAKWTEDKHTVSVAVSPAGAGSVQVNSSNVSSVTGVGIATKSDEMTPIALAGWKFKEWQVSSANVQLDLTEYHQDYQTSGTNSMKINATADDQTLTAVFEPRYYLVGGIWNEASDDPSGGMPGWNNYSKPFKVVTTSPVLDTCKVTLETNKSFYIEVRDKADGYSYGKSDGTLNDNTTLTFTDKDNKVFVYSNGGTEYTFKITGIDGSGRPTVSVERPYQVNIGRKRVDIDGTDHDDNTGGTVAMSLTVGGDAVANGAWVPYGTSVKYDASKQTGYTVDWYNASDYVTWFSNADYWFHTATSTGNGYAKFTEISTSVTLSATHGHINVGESTATSTTCGVTTTRSLTAVPDDGYKFTNWTTSSDPDFGVDDDDNTSVTLTGHGAGTAGTLTANFEERYSIKGTMDAPNWETDHIISNYTTNASGDVIGYVDITLSANTNYEFAIYDKATSGWLKNNDTELYYMTNGNSHVWDFATGRTYNCGITTAGAGTYRFMWNITDKTMSVIYPNFVIYRTGDKDEDSESASHTTTSAVESYVGGTISQAIEYRMKVNALDTWYSLCLPFTVTAVKVWDEEDGRYYNILPYYRTEVGGTLKDGHYYIRTPKQATNFSISEFSDWRDPANSSFIPAKNTPYIIRWHKSYFSGRYVSFFSATDEEIPEGMSSPGNPNENTVNVCVNQSMTDGSVAGAYMLENDYGNGAWLRLDNVETLRTIPPFECYIVGASGVVAGFPRLRGDMTVDNNATGWETIDHPAEETSKILIDGQLYIVRGGKLYTVQGMIAK